MISRETLQNILEAGVQAPSGGNSQPWRFQITNGGLSVCMVPEKDHAILNFGNRGTILANGALVENMVIAARHFGIEPTVQPFPDSSKPNLVAKISLKEKKDHKDSEATIFWAIWKRVTNRKPFETKAIDEEIKKRLIESPAKTLGTTTISLKVTDDRHDIERLAAVASTNEAVMFADEQLHKLFFKELVWNEKDERAKKAGLYIKTMELKPPQAAALRLFKHWRFMQFINKFGAAKGIAQTNTKGYAACGLYGAVLCDNNDEDFFNVGRVIERAWLTATAAGLSFHLQTGVNFLYQRVAAGGEQLFSPEHTAIIREGYKTMADIFQADGKCIPAIFRIGYDGEPSARSSKRSPEIIVT
jgi:hypothetical protein